MVPAPGNVGLTGDIVREESGVKSQDIISMAQVLQLQESQWEYGPTTSVLRRLAMARWRACPYWHAVLFS